MTCRSYAKLMSRRVSKTRSQCFVFPSSLAAYERLHYFPNTQRTNILKPRLFQLTKITFLLAGFLFIRPARQNMACSPTVEVDFGHMISFCIILPWCADTRFQLPLITKASSRSAIWPFSVNRNPWTPLVRH